MGNFLQYSIFNTMKTDKSSKNIRDIQEFKDTWTLDNALHILKHPTVDSKLWADAVEWLVLFGTPEIKKLLLSASGHAIGACFPELKVKSYSADGEPCYEIADLARSLGIDSKEAQEILLEKEKSHGIRHGFMEEETTKIQ